jgi:hypothetical protein
LPFVRVSRGIYDPLEGDRHILENNVEAIIGCEGFKRGDDIVMPEAAK